MVTLTLTLTLTLWCILFPEYHNETSGITTDQSEQATLPLPLQFCQSTFRNSDFRGPQLAKTTPRQNVCACVNFDISRLHIFWHHIYLAANFTKFNTNNLLYCCNRSLSKSMLPSSSISFNFLVWRFRKSLQQSKAVRTSMSVNRCFCSVVRDTGGLLSGYEVNLVSSSTVMQHLWHHLVPGLYT